MAGLECPGTARQVSSHPQLQSAVETTRGGRQEAGQRAMLYHHLPRHRTYLSNLDFIERPHLIKGTEGSVAFLSIK